MKSISYSQAGIGSIALLCLLLGFGTLRSANFWITPDQRGDRRMREGKPAEAAKSYSDPWRIGTAQYRDGSFESAAQTFNRVPGATGAYNQGNAHLMRGKYDAAIASFDRALALQPGWKEAAENRALAVARKDKMEHSGQSEAEPPDLPPDQIVFDLKKSGEKTQTIELTGAKLSDQDLQATWLRRVQTKPADFLRAKFAYQAANAQPGREAPP